jgi:hypothetical protein
MCFFKAFLEEGRYIPWQECQEQGLKKASRASFKRTIGRSRPVSMVCLATWCRTRCFELVSSNADGKRMCIHNYHACCT